MAGLPTKILPKNVLNAVKRARPVYTFGRRLRFAWGSRLGARPVDGLSGRVHYNDFMLTSPNRENVASYRRGACEFVQILDQSLKAAGRDFASIDNALEVGCGYGRIIRELRDRLAPQKISVADVIEEGARFTADEFGVKRIPVVERAGPEFDGRFDLIYLLSVYSHLPRNLVVANLRRLTAMLKPGGVLIFTTHGQVSADTAERYDQYWLDKQKVLAGVARDGYYYERYPYYYDEYGLTWFSHQTMKNLVAETSPSLSLVSWKPAGADHHQDVYVWRKNDERVNNSNK